MPTIARLSKWRHIYVETVVMRTPPWRAEALFWVSAGAIAFPIGVLVGFGLSAEAIVTAIIAAPIGAFLRIRSLGKFGEHLLVPN
jgi:hypothetical protein